MIIGDGDSLDNLEATSRAAEAVGFSVLGSASISATLERTRRAKGQQRASHPNPNPDPTLTQTVNLSLSLRLSLNQTLPP